VRAKIYEVRDLQTDQLIVSGTAKACAEKIGMHPDSVRQIAVGYFNSKKYRVSELPPDPEPIKPVKPAKPAKPSQKDLLAAQWDAVCDPIRKRFGIQVHSSKGGS